MPVPHRHLNITISLRLESETKSRRFDADPRKRCLLCSIGRISAGQVVELHSFSAPHSLLSCLLIDSSQQ